MVGGIAATDKAGIFVGHGLPWVLTAPRRMAPHHINNKLTCCWLLPVRYVPVLAGAAVGVRGASGSGPVKARGNFQVCGCGARGCGARGCVSCRVGGVMFSA